RVGGAKGVSIEAANRRATRRSCDDNGRLVRAQVGSVKSKSLRVVAAASVGEFHRDEHAADLVGCWGPANQTVGAVNTHPGGELSCHKRPREPVFIGVGSAQSIEIGLACL